MMLSSEQINGIPKGGLLTSELEIDLEVALANLPWILNFLSKVRRAKRTTQVGSGIQGAGDHIEFYDANGRKLTLPDPALGERVWEVITAILEVVTVEGDAPPSVTAAELDEKAGEE